MGPSIKSINFFYYNSLSLFSLGWDKFITVIVYHVKNTRELLAFERTIISQSSFLVAKEKSKQIELLFMDEPKILAPTSPVF